MIEKDDDEDKLRTVANEAPHSLDDALEKVRDDYMDGSVIDRFYLNRKAPWRFLVEDLLAGKGLVIGNHEEVVGLLLAEVLEEVFVVDTNAVALSALGAVADARDLPVTPIHGKLDSLPFPSESFDVIAIECDPSDVTSYIEQLPELLTPAGSFLLIVDGWPQALGLTRLFGLGYSSTENGFSALRYGHLFGLRRAVQRGGLRVGLASALLSTSRYENERTFAVDDKESLQWLLRGSGKAATSPAFRVTRSLAIGLQALGGIQQCYPRYFLACSKRNGPRARQKNRNSLLISGKNRTTELILDDDGLDRIRKYPNSKRHAELNTNADRATANIHDSCAAAIPESHLADSTFGPVRVEQEVTGIPLDQSLAPTPASVEFHLEVVLDWLIDFQKSTTTGWITKSPEQVREDLTFGAVGLRDPPVPQQEIEIPLVTAHGDFFGSNIYIADSSVSGVIDWEWGQLKANPMIDSGFVILQMVDWASDHVATDEKISISADSAWGELCHRQVSRYCEQIGIERRAFFTYFPFNFVTRSRRDLALNGRLDLDWSKKAQNVFEEMEDVASTLHNPNNSGDKQ